MDTFVDKPAYRGDFECFVIQSLVFTEIKEENWI